MNRAFFVTATLLLVCPPAFGQSAHEADMRDSSYARSDHDLEDMLRAMGEGRGMGRRGGPSFFLKSGDSIVAVRCDPQDSMKSCVDATITLLERAKSVQAGGGTQSGAPGSQPQSR
jgi:hypothetical protein